MGCSILCILQRHFTHLYHCLPTLLHSGRRDWAQGLKHSSEMSSCSAPPEQKQSPAPPLPLLKPASSPLIGEVFAQTTEQWLCSSFWYIHQGRENTPQNHQPVHQLLNYKIIIITLKKTKPNTTQIVTDANGWDAAPCPRVIRISRKHTRAFQTPMCCSTALLAPASSCPHQCHQQHSVPKRWQLLKGKFKTFMLWQLCF